MRPKILLIPKHNKIMIALLKLKYYIRIKNLDVKGYC